MTPRDRYRIELAIWAVVVVIAILAALFWASRAHANHPGWEWLQHDPVTGGQCCSKDDCHYLSPQQVRIVAGG